MKNRLKLLLAALAIGGTVAGAAVYALSDGPVYISPSYAESSMYYECTRPLKEGYVWDNDKRGLIPSPQGNSSNFTFSWNNGDSTHFTIQLDKQYLTPVDKSTNLQLSNSPAQWYATQKDSHVIIQSPDASRGLLWRNDNEYDIVKNYAVSNLGTVAYHAFSFWEPDDYKQWLSWGCENRPDGGVFAKDCLRQLAYGANKQEPEPVVSEPESSTSDLGQSDDPQQSNNVVYTFTSKEWNAKIGDKADNWQVSKEGYGFSNDGIQVTADTSGASATSPSSYNNVSKIILTYNTNKSAGAGEVAIQIGDNDAVEKNWGYTSGDGRTSNYLLQYDYPTPQTGTITITVNTKTNSIYLVSCQIFYSNN